MLVMKSVCASDCSAVLTIDRHFLDLGEELIFVDHQLRLALLVAQLNLVRLANDLAGFAQRERRPRSTVLDDDVI